LTEIVASGIIGLVAGVFGGLAGVGGAIVILPSLGVLFGYPAANTHHGYMAAAMVVTCVVAIPAALRHHKHKAVRLDLLPAMLVATGLAVAAGVLVSNWLPGWHLQLGLAGALVFFSVQMFTKALRRLPEAPPRPELTTRPRIALCGALAGLPAGLLGLGGGIINVPLFQSLLGLPLRTAIATSSALICLTSPIGAGLKLASLAGLGESAGHAMMLALVMSPSAIIGARLGASLTHRLPLVWVRCVIGFIMLLASVRLTHAAGRLAGWW
ncbi:MAG: sulfite exporter TauE/SafE family protein, partial [Phycisphaerales bacterium]